MFFQIAKEDPEKKIQNRPVEESCEESHKEFLKKDKNPLWNNLEFSSRCQSRIMESKCHEGKSFGHETWTSLSYNEGVRRNFGIWSHWAIGFLIGLWGILCQHEFWIDKRKTPPYHKLPTSKPFLSGQQKFYSKKVDPVIAPCKSHPLFQIWYEIQIMAARYTSRG